MRAIILSSLLAGLLLSAGPVPAESISKKTSGMQRFEGFFTFYWDSSAGKLYLEIDRWKKEFLYVNSLATGIGSNDIGLDRGQLGRGRVVRFEKAGPKVLLVQPNYEYRAVTDNRNERLAAEEAFAQSILWGFSVVANDRERVLVDATDFFLHDAHDVIGTLKRTGQGSYTADDSRSAFYLPRTKDFPLNSEFEVTLTFTGADPGQWVRQVVPTPEAITVREHHSFVQLPDSGYTPRRFDPRAGYAWMSYQDYATPVTEPLTRRFITRHRLKKKDPSARISEPVMPIVYYVDPGTPEPIRSALIDGAQWWNQAFEAAGYRNAFRVEVLPEGADPMDVRYNVIQWVHRATRGWSYGGSIEDPRTGEIIKGHVTLGSLRIRQDFLIAQGLVGDYGDGAASDSVMLEMSLARIRQLAAHEVGHTLGLMHNYIASTENRASVMDYPAPYVSLADDSTLDLSHAYAEGIGEWDKVSIAYGYEEFRNGTDEAKALDSIITEAAARGLIFLTDQDARPPGSAHPMAHLWDNGTDAIDELNRVMQVRAAGLRNFSEGKIRPDEPLALLEDVLAPLYLSHRYQVEAAAKVLGGLQYTYAIRGDNQVAAAIVPASDQRRAIEAMMTTLRPEALTIPERILKLIPPRPAGYSRTAELFQGRTGISFDPLSAAEGAARHTVALMLDPERAARLVEYHALDNDCPGLDEVIGRLLDETWYAPHGVGYSAEIRRAVDETVLYQLLSLADNDSAPGRVRGIALLRLKTLRNWLEENADSGDDTDEQAHITFALTLLKRFEENPASVEIPREVELPAGPPIGEPGCMSYEDPLTNE